MQYLLFISIGYFAALVPLVGWYKKLEPVWFRLFAWFIAAEYLMQIAGQMATTDRRLLLHGSSHYLVNIHLLVAHCFYLYIYSLAFQKAVFKRLSQFLLIAFVAAFVTEALFFKDVFTYLTLSDTIGRIGIFIVCLLYMSQLLADESELNSFRIPMFWITTGLLVCILGDWVYVLFHKYLSDNQLDVNGRINYILLIITNNLQYLFFATGFWQSVLWKKGR